MDPAAFFFGADPDSHPRDSDPQVTARFEVGPRADRSEIGPDRDCRSPTHRMPPLRPLSHRGSRQEPVPNGSLSPRYGSHEEPVPNENLSPRGACPYVRLRVAVEPLRTRRSGRGPLEGCRSDLRTTG
jgi:hypothetical protein